MPTVMITGTNRGFGFEFVKQYAADGWRVFAAYRHPTSADSLRLLAERSKDLAEVVTMDVTDLRSVKQAAAQIGSGAVDVLINSAGIAGSEPGVCDLAAPCQRWRGCVFLPYDLGILPVNR